MTMNVAGQTGAAMQLRGNVNEEQSNTPATGASPRRFKIDVGRQVADIERTLRAGGNFTACARDMAILRRWQFDEMLDDASREKAKMLVREFAGSDWNESLR